MPLIYNVGLTKKIGLPDYGSLGASCSVQCELDSHLLQTDPEAFQQQVRNAYVACTQAVNDQLARQQSPSATVDDQRPAGTAPSDRGGNGPGRATSTNGHGATTKQLDYVRQLATQIKGLGVRRLDAIAQRMFSKPVADMTTLDASGLIDTLKEIKSGKIDLASMRDGAAS